MKSQGFLGAFTPVDRGVLLPGQAIFILAGRKIAGRLEAQESTGAAKAGQVLVHVSLRRSVSLQWKDEFEALDSTSLKSLGHGYVLFPYARRPNGLTKKKEAEFLRALCGSEKKMLEALCREKGSAGLHQREMEDFSGLDRSRLLRVAQKLEEEGRIKILRFSPLFLLSEESYCFLLEQVVRYVESHLQEHPGRKGVPIDKLKKRFSLSTLVLRLALKALEQAGRLRQEGQRVTLPSHEVKLSAEEERILSRLEEMCFRGELRSLSLGEIQREFRLSPERLEKLLSILMERKKVFQGAEGLYIHAHWLEEVISRVKSLGKKEMTVGEFKALTGLSRKYAIPLLELLDQMGVTRRKGPTREIL